MLGNLIKRVDASPSLSKYKDMILLDSTQTLVTTFNLYMFYTVLILSQCNVGTPFPQPSQTNKYSTCQLPNFTYNIQK